MNQNLSSLAFAEDFINVDEYVECVLLEKQRNKPVRHEFDMNMLTDDQVLKEFRFTKPQLHKLCDLLHFPDYLKAENGSKIRGLDGLCLLLRRLAYPQRLHDDEELFGYSSPELSMFFNLALYHVHDMFGHLLTSLEQEWMTSAEIKSWANAITEKGSPFDRCVGFIDGTNIEICRWVIKIFNRFINLHKYTYKSFKGFLEKFKI